LSTIANPSSRPLPWRLAAVLFALVVLASWLSLALTRLPGGVATLWLANGLIVGTLLATPTPDWRVLLPVGVAGQLLVRAWLGDALDVIVVLTLANVLEISVVAIAVRRRFDDIGDPARWLGLGRVASTTSAMACLVSGAIAAAWLARQARGDFVALYPIWVGSHLIGMVIIATLTLVVHRAGLSVMGRPGRRIGFAMTQVLILVVSVGIFTQSAYPFLFLAYPPLLLAAFRHRFAGVVGGIAILAIVGTIATGAGLGPLSLVRDADPTVRTLLLQLFVGTACAMTFPVALVLAERSRFASRMRASEARYRMLADYSHDIVVRMRADGQRLYVSPSTRELLGWEPEELMAPRWELVHPDDREILIDALSLLPDDGTPGQMIYRARHRDGHWVWIEAVARRVPSEKPGEPMDIIYSGREVSERVSAELIAAESQLRLERVTNNIPALVSHMDRERRYTFVNAAHRAVFKVAPAELVGRTVRDVIGDENYAGVEAHIETALAGEAVTFTSEGVFNGRLVHFQANYVPDLAPDGSVQGFFALTFDISKMKRAEEALAQLAREDSLTGLANRRQFDERLALALSRAQRQRLPMVLMYLDIDHFKDINDTFGHAAGDEVIQAFASRLTSVVREGDLVARFGGDEFVVMIEDAASPEIAERIARKLIALMGEGIAVGEASVPVTTSIGIAFAADAVSAEALMAAADGALYAAKAGGRNTFRLIAL
jgi:diguanylate cyclase (GGDEF)-like protein/PAS domain S-box-containing protein